MYKIAIIEDDTAIREMYQLKFEQSGFEVEVATDGYAGLKLCKQFNPALVLLDLRMPKLSGDKMLIKLRESKWGADIRVVVLTNISKDEAPSSLRFLGVERYVVKSHYTPTQVVEVAKEVLGIR